MTPAIAAAKAAYPQAHITVLVRAGTQSILDGCPQVDEILTTVAPEKKKRRASSLALVKALCKERFDAVFELGHGDRGRWLGFLAKAKKRYSYYERMPFFWKKIYSNAGTAENLGSHQVLRDYQLVAAALNLEDKVPGSLVFDRSRTQPHGLDVSSRGYVVVHPVTRWKRKYWQLDRWVQVCQWIEKQGLQVVVSVGPSADEKKIGNELAESVEGAICTQGKLGFAQLADLLYGAKAFAGVDTAVMHLAAACGVSGVALFGPTNQAVWRPWQSSMIVIQEGSAKPEQGETREEHEARALKMMERIQVPTVIDALDKSLRA